MATIRKRKSDYQIIVSLGEGRDGKQIRKYATFKPTETAPTKIKKEVEAFAAGFEHRVKEGECLDGEKLTLNDYFETWRTSYAADHLTDVTIKNYTLMYDKRFRDSIGNVKLNKLRAGHLDTIFKQMTKEGCAATTVHRYHSLISGILKHAYKKGIVRENVAKRCDLPKIDASQKMKCFTPEQAEKFLNLLEDDRYYSTEGFERRITAPMFRAYFNLAIFSGCRRSELVALTWNDIDFKEQTITIYKAAAPVKGKEIKDTKTRAGHRLVSLPRSCMDVLKEWKITQKKYAFSLGTAWTGARGKEYDNNPVFIQCYGAMMWVTTPSHEFKKFIANYNASCEKEEDKLPVIRLHDLRHTNATLLIASQQIDIVAVSKRLGHQKVSTTLDIYSHALPAQDKKAADTLENILKAE